MGSLTPGATYIYERHNGTVYAREFGADPNTRQIVGWDYDPKTPTFTPSIDPRTTDGRPLHEHLMEDKLWGDIRREAMSNPTLQKAMDRVIMIYKLSKEKVE